MRLEAVIEACAGFEKRALWLYRKLAERFGDNARASRHWRQMSDAEAGHFTLLQLALDWVSMAGEPSGDVGLEPPALDALGAQLGRLEQAADRAGLTLAEAVELTLAWEELELPRILELIRHLPEQVRERVRTGLLGETDRHYGDLLALVKEAEAAGLEARAEALRDRALTR